MKVDRNSSKSSSSRSESQKTEKPREASRPQEQKPAASQPQNQKVKTTAEYAGQSTFKPAGQRAPVALQAPQANTANTLAANTLKPPVENGGFKGFGELVGDGLNALGNAANTVGNAVGNVASGAVNTVTGVIGAGASAVQQAAQLLTTDPGANLPNAIDRANLSQLDKAVVNGLGLDDIPPGSSVEVEVEVNGHLAAVLGVEVGASVTMTVERGAENPNEFTLGFGGGGSVDGIATGNTMGARPPRG